MQNSSFLGRARGKYPHLIKRVNYLEQVKKYFAFFIPHICTSHTDVVPIGKRGTEEVIHLSTAVMTIYLT